MLNLFSFSHLIYLTRLAEILLVGLPRSVLHYLVFSESFDVNPVGNFCSDHKKGMFLHNFISLNLKFNMVMMILH